MALGLTNAALPIQTLLICWYLHASPASKILLLGNPALKNERLNDFCRKKLFDNMHKPWVSPQLKQFRKEKTEKNIFLCTKVLKSLPYCPLHYISDTFPPPFEECF